MPMKNNREYREMVLEVMAIEEPQEEDRKTVAGYATTFNEPYVLYEDGDIVFREQVAPGAFAEADMTDTIMQYNHEGRVFARITNGTLRVKPDERGLYIEADLGGTEIGRELYDEIRGGYTDKMSFGFIVSDDEQLRTNAEDGRVDVLRTITGISKLFDVSAVSIPANDGTSIGAQTRGRIDGVIEEVRAERLEVERLNLEREKVKARVRALGGNV
ncbi:HK97 family phage prohead protease [Candidatus Saccharibacteria bacterium]|nr:HK97 family phage prohead protease [Candidatus Saccharibacteria bacterium]